MVNGILPVYKPATSSIEQITKLIKQHSAPGQLVEAAAFDEHASSGVILILLGSMREELAYFEGMSRQYRVFSRMGYRSDNGLITGTLTKQPRTPLLSKNKLEEVAESMIGMLNQSPTHYAKQLNKDEERLITRYKEVSIEQIEIESYQDPLLYLSVTCTPETNIPQLTSDLTIQAGIQSVVLQIEQLAVGDIGIGDCAFLEDIINESWDAFLFTPEEELL